VGERLAASLESVGIITVEVLAGPDCDVYMEALHALGMWYNPETMAIHIT
jgi:hypothetical protein